MLVLASASPRRHELMRFITVDFEVVRADLEEKIPSGFTPREAVETLAAKKAAAVAEQRPGDVIIGADTTVALGVNILGKPRDKQDAISMLSMLSGKTHAVLTGVCIVTPQKTEVFSQTTEVTFLRLSAREIEAYADTNEPYDKAGSYGIQGVGALFVSELKGDFYNVVGLPISLLAQKLKKLGILPS